jgi:hypothetical protein
MRKFIIERNIPGVGAMSPDQICGAAAKSNEVLAGLAPRVQWVQSYVAADRLYCIYLAEDEKDVQRHAEISGFPAHAVMEVRRVIDPITANGV